MPDSRSHRGSHPQDEKLFSEENSCLLRKAVKDVSWMLTRGYNRNSALKAAGDRYALQKRQRTAVGRSACSDQHLDSRLSREIENDSLAGESLFLDGYNVLTTIEAALGGGVILSCRDSTFRDMASMKGTYRKVEETVPAIDILRKTLSRLNVPECLMYLDQPVSNSGRLKKVILGLVEEDSIDWDVKLVKDPDKELIQTNGVVVSADSQILDGCKNWFNLARKAVEWYVGDYWEIDLKGL